MNYYYIETAYKKYSYIKYAYDLYYNPLGVIFNAQNIYITYKYLFPYINNINNNNRHIEDIELKEFS